VTSITDRIKTAWNIFRYGEEFLSYSDLGVGYTTRPDRIRLYLGNERTIISSIYTKIAVHASSIPINHIRLDENDKFLEIIKSNLNNCLTLEANIDQTGQSFFHDVVMSMLDEGVVGIVPTEYSANPKISGTHDILSMRTGKIVEWYPENVKVNLYNQVTGQKEDLILPKSLVAIVENPFYSVMNEPNSTLRRLVDKLNLLDVIDKQSGSGKLDLIIQLPYVIKTQTRREQAETRRKDIESQLQGSKYGIAYTDGTEKITQLNRPAENNLLAQIEYLTNMLFSQLGLTKEIFDGTAEEAAMINYYNGTIDPILTAITVSMKRTFLTKTARSQGQSIGYLRDPFKLVSMSQIADVADKFTRNEILSSNEIRSIVGFKPSKQKGADDLRNKNIQEATTPPKENVVNNKEEIKMEGDKINDR
jgi:hypothetical protein